MFHRDNKWHLSVAKVTSNQALLSGVDWAPNGNNHNVVFKNIMLPLVIC